MNALILHERDLLTVVKAKVKQRVKMTSDESQTQKQRERFASPVKSISPSDDPKFKSRKVIGGRLTLAQLLDCTPQVYVEWELAAAIVFA